MATEIGTFVRRMRTEAMMTQQDVAKRSGISRSYLSRLESGDIARPSADFLIKIARAIGVHPDVFFEAGGYRSYSTDEGQRRRDAIDWLEAETRTWRGDELLHWGRLMIYNREWTQEWLARRTGAPA